VRREWGRHLGEKFGDQASREWTTVVDSKELIALNINVVRDERTDRNGEVFVFAQTYCEGALLAVYDPGWLGTLLGWDRDAQGPRDCKAIRGLGTTTGYEGHLRGKRQDEWMSEKHVVGRQVVGDLAHVPFDLGTLVSNQTTVVVTIDPGHACDLEEFVASKSQ
jgi:hypothetical protein